MFWERNLLVLKYAHQSKFNLTSNYWRFVLTIRSTPSNWELFQALCD